MKSSNFRDMKLRSSSEVKRCFGGMFCLPSSGLKLRKESIITIRALISTQLADVTIKINIWGCAIAQAVRRRLPTAAARVRSCGICGGQSGAEADFLRVFRFPLPIFIPLIPPQSSSIIWGSYNRPVVAAVPSGLSLTPLRIKIIKKEDIVTCISDL
jgi:hypothetical protein